MTFVIDSAHLQNNTKTSFTRQSINSCKINIDKIMRKKLEGRFHVKLINNFLLIVLVKENFLYFVSVLNRSQISFCGYIFLFENGMQNILKIFSLMTSSNKGN